MQVNKPKFHRTEKAMTPPDLSLGVTWRPALGHSDESESKGSRGQAGRGQAGLPPAQRMSGQGLVPTFSWQGLSPWIAQPSCQWKPQSFKNTHTKTNNNKNHNTKKNNLMLSVKSLRKCQQVLSQEILP